MSATTAIRRFAPFALLGIVLGCAMLIVVVVVGSGFRAELRDNVRDLNGHLLVRPLESPLRDYEAVAARIAKIPGVIVAAPILDGQALASSPFYASVLVRGIRGADLVKLGSIANSVKQGTLEGFDEARGVAVGRRLAESFSLRVGDSITLVSPRGVVTPMGTTARVKAYKITAIFEIGMSEYESSIIYMPLEESQAYFNRSGDVTAIEVFIDKPDSLDRYRGLVSEATRQPVFVEDWRQRNSFTAVQDERPPR